MALQNPKIHCKTAFDSLGWSISILCNRVCLHTLLHVFFSAMFIETWYYKGLYWFEMVYMFQIFYLRNKLSNKLYISKSCFIRLTGTHTTDGLHLIQTCILKKNSLCSMTHFLFFHTLCLGLQGVEHCGLFFFFFAWFLVSSYTHSFFLLSVYCDEIGKVLLCSIHVW